MDAPQHSTDDEIHGDSKEHNVKNETSSKKKNKKIRKEPKTCEYVVVVPEVDSIDHAYLSSKKMSVSELARRKERLMGRKVNQCNDFVKGKKEKREIRMLGN